jgi:hypothetical protein
MDSDQHSPYIPGLQTSVLRPLDRYLPPIQAGVAATWLEQNLPTGSWLLDPFGAAPSLAVEAAQRGYRILVAANNPINRFILEMQANPPSAADFQAALAALAATTISKERLEPHIKSLYSTCCAECNAQIPVEAFLWKAGATAPYSRIYTCPQCKDSGERAITATDITAANHFSKSGLHHARAMERVAPLNDPDRNHVEEALMVYPPRAIYVLVSIINKLNTLTPDQHRCLAALLLVTFDQANTLWPHPIGRARPRQLTVPPQYRENNIWMALESAISIWTTAQQPIPLTYWPEEPPADGGICLFRGRIKSLANQIANLDLAAVVTAFPRPNQAFWTLSALWSGWLWGPEALEHFKSVLRRRRYDWGWHTTAISAALDNLNTQKFAEIPFWGTINEVEPGFLSAVILGTKIGGFRLTSLSLRDEDHQAQLLWQGLDTRNEETEATQSLATLIPSATKQHLLDRGEPAAYIYCHGASLFKITAALPTDLDQTPFDYFGQVQGTFQQELSFKNKLLRFEGSSNSLEVGQWWLEKPVGLAVPLADRIEIAIVQFLINNPASSSIDIDRSICADFPGLLPPEPSLIQMCLESYGYQNSATGDLWSLKDQDRPEKRRQDLEEMENLLQTLGQRLNYQVSMDRSSRMIEWHLNDKVEYTFFISAAALLEKYLTAPNPKPKKLHLVLPGSRANLVAYKLKCNPHFDLIASQRWHFIKYRLLRQLSESENIHLDNIVSQLRLDPLAYLEPQMRLF